MRRWRTAEWKESFAFHVTGWGRAGRTALPRGDRLPGSEAATAPILGNQHPPDSRLRSLWGAGGGRKLTEPATDKTRLERFASFRSNWRPRPACQALIAIRWQSPRLVTVPPEGFVRQKNSAIISPYLHPSVFISRVFQNLPSLNIQAQSQPRGVFSICYCLPLPDSITRIKVPLQSWACVPASETSKGDRRGPRKRQPRTTAVSGLLAPGHFVLEPETQGLG